MIPDGNDVRGQSEQAGTSAIGASARPGLPLVTTSFTDVIIRESSRRDEDEQQSQKAGTSAIWMDDSIAPISTFWHRATRTKKLCACSGSWRDLLRSVKKRFEEESQQVRVCTGRIRISSRQQPYVEIRTMSCAIQPTYTRVHVPLISTWSKRFTIITPGLANK